MMATERDFDVIVIGAGAAGLSAALFTTREQLKTLIIERMTFGGQIANAETIENYPGLATSIRGIDLAINMLDHREFWDIETTRELLRTFEQKEKLAELLTALAAESGVRVTIGDENPVAAMRECTLVTSTYMYRDQVLGILGVVGPRRLPYPEVISIVSETAQHVTEALSRVRQDLYLPS